MRLLHANVLVLNTGLWGGNASALIPMMRRIAAQMPQLRTIWKTTTLEASSNHTPDMLAESIKSELPDLEVFDARLLTGSIAASPLRSIGYWDTKHFAEPVYALLNAALLSQLASGWVPP